MKKVLTLFYILCISLSAFAQVTIKTIDVTTNDLVYDPISDRIYASLPGSNGANGNSIGVINPHTCALENTVYMGPDPVNLAISDDGQFIYTGFAGSPTIKRFDIQSQSAGPEFSLGEHPFWGPFFAWDIEVMPGHPETVAVTRITGGSSSNEMGIAIYDNGVMRYETTGLVRDYNQIEFIDSDKLLSYTNKISSFDLKNFYISDTGFVELWCVHNLISGFNVDFVYHEDRVYSTNGIIGDIAGIPYVLGTLAEGAGPVVYDEFYNLVCFASCNYQDKISLKRFSPDNFMIRNDFPISDNIGYPISLIGCGKDCYAFNTTKNRVVVVKVNSLGIDQPDNTTQVLIYPNPATDVAMIKADSGILSVRVRDVSGRVLTETDYPEGSTINLSEFKQGIYIAEITLDNNLKVVRKIIKQ